MPSAQQIKRLQEMMDKFCKGTLRIAKQKLYLPAKEGGLGLINLHEFLIALQCSWVKRVTQHWGDNWRFDLKKKCYGNPILAGSGTFSNQENPVLSTICTSFGKFKSAFYSIGNNFKKAHIFKNPYFRRGRNDNGLLCERFFGFNRLDPNSEIELRKIALLKFENFFSHGGAKTLDEINREYDLNFNLVTYMRLHEALQFAVDSKRNADTDLSLSIEYFFKSFDRGSKPFRRILQHEAVRKCDITKLNTVVTFFTTCQVDRPEKKIISECWKEWNYFFYNNRCREFLFKYRNNILGINARVSHFVPEVQAECSLCILNKEPLPIQSETFSHVFYDCPYSNKYRMATETSFFPELRNAADPVRRKFWFTAQLPNPEAGNLFVSAVVNFTNFSIWECKLNKQNLAISLFQENLTDSLKKALKMSRNLREVCNNSRLFVCRHFSDPP
jgi:hypothetical protein